MLGITISLLLFSSFIIPSEIELLQRIGDGDFVSGAEIRENDSAKTGFSVIIFFATIASAIPLLMWKYRIAENLRSFNRAELRFSPGWAVGWWFVPIWNLFKPYQVMQEFWKGSDPSIPLDQPTGWVQSPGSNLISWWWAHLNRLPNLGAWTAFQKISNSTSCQKTGTISSLS